MRSAIILQTINHQEGNLGGRQNIFAVHDEYWYFYWKYQTESINQSHQFDIIITYAIIQKYPKFRSRSVWIRDRLSLRSTGSVFDPFCSFWSTFQRSRHECFQVWLSLLLPRRPGCLPERASHHLGSSQPPPCIAWFTFPSSWSRPVQFFSDSKSISAFESLSFPSDKPPVTLSTLISVWGIWRRLNLIAA